MKYITYINIGAKTFFTISIFFFVQEQSDYLMVPLLTAMGFIFAGVWSLMLVKKTYDVRFKWQTLETLMYQLEEGWHVFISSMAISFYTISTTFILGILTNNTVVGYFAAADKIVQAVKGLYAPVSQAIYPLISKKINEDKLAGLEFIGKIKWVVSSAMFITSAILLIFAEPIVYLLLGQQYQQSIMLLKIMAVLPFVISLSNIYGIQTMLNLGYKKAFSSILVAAAILGVVLSFIFVPKFEALGSVWTVLGVEIFVTLTMYFYLKQKLNNE